ncbi:MAG TPA: EAL domain-containing protein [Pseudohongiella sp.]|nr:EAL domain-containing protein [Pseudohongiella sp.]
MKSRLSIVDNLARVSSPSRTHVNEKAGYYQGSRYLEFESRRLYSAFQPIYSIAHKRIVGLEALVRAIDEHGASISPVELFGKRQGEAVHNLDLTCQQVHLQNFHALDPPDAWLFLNVDPATLSRCARYTTFLCDLLVEYGYTPNRVVIEILESSIEDESELEQTIGQYKDLGFLIAIDDFGAGHSNFERIWRIQPDIVKLDRGMLKKAGQDASVKELLKGITSMLHNCKCLVLAEGVETTEEALAAMDAQVDLIQGYYFARPFLLSESIATRRGLWKELYNEFDELNLYIQERKRDSLEPYRNRLVALTVGAQKKNLLEDIAQLMFKLPHTIRLYQLALDGEQCHANINSATIQIEGRDRLHALANAQGASWKRRDYYVNAVNNPGNVQMTQPYFSVSDGTLCITLSVLTRLNGEDFIVCCDILPGD